MAAFLAILFNVITFISTPFKSLAVYEHYFVISAQTEKTRQRQHRNQKLVQLFWVLLCLHLYFACQYVVLLFLASFYPFSTTITTVHVVTFDFVYAFHFFSHIYIFVILNCLMTAFCLHLFYFRPNSQLNDQLKRALFSDGSSEDSSPVSAKTPLAPPLSADTCESVRKVVTTITNLLESFIPTFLLCAVLIFATQLRQLYLHLAALRCTAPEWAAYAVVFLSHALVYYAFTFTFLYIIGFLGSFFFAVLTLLTTLVRENNRQIMAAVRQSRQNQALSSGELCSSSKTLSRLLLRANLLHFRLLFSAQAFVGNAFLAFLAVNMPCSALFSVMLLFFRRMEAGQLLLVGCTAAYQAVGTVLLHVLYAQFSRRLHWPVAGLLVGLSASASAFTARASFQRRSQSRGSDGQPLVLVSRRKWTELLEVRGQLTLWAHTARLLTANRYGFTYGLIGAPVTMATLARVCRLLPFYHFIYIVFSSINFLLLLHYKQCFFLYLKLVLYSYSLVKYSHRH